MALPLGRPESAPNSDERTRKTIYTAPGEQGAFNLRVTWALERPEQHRTVRHHEAGVPGLVLEEALPDLVVVDFAHADHVPHLLDARAFCGAVRCMCMGYGVLFES